MAVSGEDLRSLETNFKSSEARIVLAYRVIKCNPSSAHERGGRKQPVVGLYTACTLAIAMELVKLDSQSC